MRWRRHGAGWGQLTNGSKVAVTIDTDARSPKALLIRGTVRIDTVAGIAPEYAAMLRRTLGEEGGQAVLAQAAPSIRA